jgi:hypothetical protein
MSALVRAAAAGLALTAAMPAAAGVRPAHGGALRLGLPALPRTTDPALAVDLPDLVAARATSGALLALDARGELAPGLLAEVPQPEVGGKAFRLRLRTDAVTFAGTPITAEDLAAAFARLASPTTASPNAWAVLPVLGADAMLAGRAAALAGVQVVGEREVLVTLAAPLPEFAHVLAALPLAIPGAGPFVPPASLEPRGGAIVLARNDRCPAGRPYLSSLVLAVADGRADPRAAARALDRGELDLVLRPEPAGPRGGPAFPATVATVAALQAGRLGPGAEAVRRALGTLDRADLARRYARGPSEPMATLVPPALLPAAAGAFALASGDAPPALPLASRIVLLVPEGASDARAASERIQVKLFDAGLRVAVEAVPRARFDARLAAGDYDVALVPVPVLSARASLAAAQIAYAIRGTDGLRRALDALSGLPADQVAPAAAELGRALDVVPLFASGPRALAGPAAQGLRPDAVGGFDPGDLWRLGGGPP